VFLTSLHVLGPTGDFIVATVLFVVVWGPTIGLRWLKFLRELRNFFNGH